MDKASFGEALDPFLRWPGGKRWLARQICDIANPKLSANYIEPFLGSGSVFFRMNPSKAILSDINTELIATYRAIRRSPSSVKRLLESYPVSNLEYSRIRDSKPKNNIERAARLIYLNCTAFSGIYRLNQKGQFNVPFGGGQRTTRSVLRTTVIEDASKALRAARLIVSDFEPVIEASRKGDVVYCDPTYAAERNSNGFVRYNENNFAWQDQERLRAVVLNAKRRGVFVVISNADHAEVRKLYAGCNIQVVERFSSICPRPNHRRKVRELLIVP